MLTDTQTITVDSSARNLAVVDYPDNGSIRKCELADGDAELIIAHETTPDELTRTMVKHTEERVVSSVDMDNRVHVVMSCADTPASRAELVKMVEGFLAYLQTAGLLAKLLLGES